ncbi:MAG: histidinol-phosphate transaminase [Rhodanobacteraceae bacterium]
MSIVERARPAIRTLQPYSSARMEARGGNVLLNANESPWPPYGDDSKCNRYPDPQPTALIEKLAALYAVRREQVLAGRGSDEAIDLLVRAFCEAGRDAILISPPVFGMYAVCAHIQGAGVIEAPLREDFALNIDAMIAAMTSAVKLVFVCAPNNPTGQIVPRIDIERLASKLTDRAIVVVDEAYVEFADAPFRSAAHLLDSYENIAVLRTLSKAYALAGARIGVLLAHPDVIALLRRIMPPYPLPAPCVEAALRALSPAGLTLAARRIEIVRNERARMRERLACAPGVRTVLASQANFLTVRFDDAGEVYRRLLDEGVVVRDVRSHPRLGDALRITIGTPLENDCVLKSLAGAAA